MQSELNDQKKMKSFISLKDNCWREQCNSLKQYTNSNEISILLIKNKIKGGEGKHIWKTLIEAVLYWLETDGRDKSIERKSGNRKEGRGKGGSCWWSWYGVDITWKSSHQNGFRKTLLFFGNRNRNSVPTTLPLTTQHSSPLFLFFIFLFCFYCFSKCLEHACINSIHPIIHHTSSSHQRHQHQRKKIQIKK